MLLNIVNINRIWFEFVFLFIIAFFNVEGNLNPFTVFVWISLEFKSVEEIGVS